MSEKKTFWATLPGIITAIAALITAISGSIAIFLQLGLISPADKKPSTHTELPQRIHIDQQASKNNINENVNAPTRDNVLVSNEPDLNNNIETSAKNTADDSASDFDTLYNGIDTYNTMRGKTGMTFLDPSTNINDYKAWHEKMNRLMPFDTLPFRAKQLMDQIGRGLNSNNSSSNIEILLNETDTRVDDLDKILEKEGYMVIR